MMKKLLPRLLIFTLALGIFSFVGIQPAHAAASLYLSPGATNVYGGSTFSVSVRTNTGGSSVNAVQANLTYPADKLDFLGISTGGTSFEITAEGSGGSGSIKIGRGTVSAKSGDLLVATVTFRAKPSSGSASVSFAGGSAVVRASDSKNVASSKVGGTYSFSKAPPAPKPKPKDTTAPKITDLKVTNLTKSSASVAWKTNEAASSVVEWGNTKKLGFTASSGKMVKTHLLKLDGKLLTRGAVYYFRAKSKDESGNVATSKISSFAVPGFRVTVTVTDKNGNPVEGATVEIVNDGKATTDANGIAILKNAPEGELTVIISYEGEILAEKITVNDKAESQDFDAKFAGMSVKKSLFDNPKTLQIVGLVSIIILLGIGLALLRYRKYKISLGS